MVAPFERKTRNCDYGGLAPTYNKSGTFQYLLGNTINISLIQDLMRIVRMGHLCLTLYKRVICKGLQSEENPDLAEKINQTTWKAEGGSPSLILLNVKIIEDELNKMDTIKEIIKDIRKRHYCKNVNMGVIVIPIFDWKCFEKRLLIINSKNSTTQSATKPTKEE